MRSLVLALGISAGLIGASQAVTFPGGPRYDGIITIVDATGASCQGVTFVGQKVNAVYRARTKPTELDEVISVEVPLGAIILRAEGDGDFQGTNQSVSGGFIIDAWQGTLPSATFNLSFTPTTITDAHGITASTDSFTFRGSVRNYSVANCTVRIKGAFTKR